MRGGGGERVKLTEEKDLCRLLALFDKFLGFLETQVDLSGNSSGLFLPLDALDALVLSLFGWGHEGGNKRVVDLMRDGKCLHGEEEGTCRQTETGEDTGVFWLLKLETAPSSNYPLAASQDARC